MTENKELPPKKRVIRLRFEWPPIKIGTTRESRNEHSTALILMGLVAALAAWKTGPMAWMGMAATLFWGYALGMYIAFPKMYEDDSA